MTRAPLHALLLAGTVAILAACSESPVSPNDIEAQFAKPVPWTPAQFGFPASGFDLVGDGLPYVDGACGVTASITPDGTTAQAGLSGNDPSCGGRTVTVRLG